MSGGTAKTAVIRYAAVTGTPMPRTNEARATRKIAASRLPLASEMMMSENLRPIPVREIVPTIMPMTPSVAPMIRVLLAPVRIASHMPFKSIVMSLRRALTKRHQTVADKVMKNWILNPNIS